MQTVLKIENLCVEGRLSGGAFQPIVKNVNFSVNEGEVSALIGESGSGKTTIALAALGYARPGCRISAGRVILDDKNILELSNTDKRSLRGQTSAYVAQSAAASFNPSLTIGYQVTEGPMIHGLMTRAMAQKTAFELYKRLDLPDPENIGKLYPHQVSGGQLQRLMAAMAMSCVPRLLVLDEPTTALDVTTQIEVLLAFKEIIKQQGVSAIYVTHDLAVVAQIADNITVLFNGEIQEQGTTENIINNPTHPYTKKLMRAVRPVPSLLIPKSKSFEEPKKESTTPLLEIKNLTAGYGRFKKKIILRNINIQIPRGSVVGIIGESGCGKSTLARAVSGLLPPMAGSMKINGHELPPLIKERTRKELKKIQIVFQMPDVSLNPRQTIGDIIGRPLEFYLNYNRTKKRHRVNELLSMVELSSKIGSSYPRELSGGQMQRVNLARALAAEPELILCDEVTSALDTVVGAAVIDLLKRLKDRLNLAFMFISHDLSTVASFADHIVVLYAGQVVEKGPLKKVLAPPYHPYTQLLLSSVPELRTGWLDEIATFRQAMTAISQSVQLLSTGCPFYPRCYRSIKGVCNTGSPPLQGDEYHGHSIYCHHSMKKLF